MNKTSIEWVKNPDGTQGYTWNPITGCLNGCEYCYARKLANGRLRERYLTNNNLAPIEGGASPSWSMFNDPFYPRFWPERLNELVGWLDNLTPSEAYRGLKSPKARGIFPCNMGELFGDWIPKHWQQQIFNVIQANSQHRFYLLTKQPQNLIKFSPFPDNCWVGVTATNQETYDSAVYYLNLGCIEAKVRYISIEPFLSHIHLPNYKDVDLLIIGAQTKPYKPPKIEWVREVVEACDKAGTKVFLKDNLKPILPDREPFYRKLSEGAGYIALSPLRQEMPTGGK